MKKILKIVLLLSICIMISIDLKATSEIGLTQDIYIKLCGVWDTRIISNNILDLSWGNAKVVVNGSTIIDLGDEKPFIHVGGTNKYSIIKVSRKCNIYIIKIIDYDNDKYDIEITRTDENLIFNKMPWFKEFHLFVEYGENNPYYKIDGPKITFYKSKIINLRLREKPTTSSKIVRLLQQDEKLLIIKRGKREVIDGITGNWVKIISDKNDIGWCFDPYLGMW